MMSRHAVKDEYYEHTLQPTERMTAMRRVFPFFLHSCVSTESSIPRGRMLEKGNYNMCELTPIEPWDSNPATA